MFYPFKAWMLIGDILGWINSRIILGLVYILVLIPIAGIMKCMKYDPLRKHKNNKFSYREDKKGYDIKIDRIF